MRFMWLAHITGSLGDIWVKVRDPLLNVPNAVENHGRRLTSNGRGRLCYRSVLKNTALTNNRANVYILKNLRTHFLMQTCTKDSQAPEHPHSDMCSYLKEECVVSGVYLTSE